MRNWLMFGAMTMLVAGCAAAEPAEDRAALGSELTAGASSEGRDLVVDQARDDRLVGEMASGYLGLVADDALTTGAVAPDDLEARVKHINIKRRALYTEIAVRRGVAPVYVAQAAACVLFRQRVVLGEAYRAEDEQWRVHTERAPVELPSFCDDEP